MIYNGVHTAFDVNKEFLIQGAELVGDNQIPLLPPINIRPEDTVDFSSSFSRKIKDFKHLNCNFYQDEYYYTRFFNSPDRYMEHLRCFGGGVCSPDFSIALGERGAPHALNLYSKFKNHALGWYMYTQGVKVIPSVSLGDKPSWDWIFDGYPLHSTLAVCTNGRVKARASRLEFCEAYYEMCRRLEPLRVVIVGYIPEELESPVEVISLKSRNQKMNEKFQKGE